jgi:hypothetical protein
MNNYKVLFHNNRFFHLLLLFTFLIIGFSTQGTNKNKKIEIDKLKLKEDMMVWLDYIQEDNLNEFGFNNKSEFSSIILGEPFYLYTLFEDSIIQSKGNEKISFEFKNEWLIPLFLNNRIASFLFIKGTTNYEIVRIGASFLVADFNYENYNPKNQFAKGIILIPSITEKIVITDDNETEFLPLGNSRFINKDSNSRTLTKRDIFNTSYEILKNHNYENNIFDTSNEYE